MTCREFENAAGTLALRELTQMQDDQLLSHAGGCQKCAAWLSEQQEITASMRALQARTARCEAGPELEQRLLRKFRQARSEAPQIELAKGFTPIAFRLSRFFEVGAYVAVAAAIVVGLFLGIHLLEERSTKARMQGQSRQARATPVPSTVATERLPAHEIVPATHNSGASAGKREVASGRMEPTEVTNATSASTDASQASGDPDYVALMFCDPLSCSTDTQVVRMELPRATASDRDGQPLVADVVVGYDGVVRAMRIVN